MKKIKQSSSTSTNHNNIYIFLISEGIAVKRVKKLAQFFQVSITIRSNNFCAVNSVEDILAIYKRLLYKSILKAKYTQKKSCLRLKTKIIIANAIFGGRKAARGRETTTGNASTLRRLTFHSFPE